jgi:hypothetical protein
MGFINVFSNYPGHKADETWFIFLISHTAQKVTETRCYIKEKSELIKSLMMITASVPYEMKPVPIGLICWFGRGT